jgi:O-antigen/teichoic acid export membrane protein
VLLAWGAGAVATLAANLYVIPRHGIEGAAAVSTAGYGLVLALHVVAVRQVRDADRRVA